jgi:hypothetical protein
MIPQEWRPYFPGKEFLVDFKFYIAEKTCYNLLTKKLEDL